MARKRDPDSARKTCCKWADRIHESGGDNSGSKTPGMGTTHSEKVRSFSYINLEMYYKDCIFVLSTIRYLSSHLN